MQQRRDLLRLSHEGCSVRDLVLRYGVTRSTIQDNLKRAKDAGLTFPSGEARVYAAFCSCSAFQFHGRSSSSL